MVEKEEADAVNVNCGEAAARQEAPIFNQHQTDCFEIKLIT